MAKTSVSQSYDEVDPDLPRGQSNAPEGASDLEQDVEIDEVTEGLDAAYDVSQAELPDQDLAVEVEPDADPDTATADDATEGTDLDDVAGPDAVVSSDATTSADVVDGEADAAVEEAATGEDAQIALAAAASDDDAQPDVLQEFRDRLQSQFGDWFVIHTYSGMENRVKTNLENRITSLNMEDYIFEVVVPTEEVSEIKNGQRKLVRRTTLPGYVLVRMDLNDESWGAVRHTPSVTGFVGNSHQPVPLSLAEVESMLAPAVHAEIAATAAASGAEPQSSTPKVEFADFVVSDSVMVVDGPFATLHATITEINVDAARVKALVEIFGRETPVELSFTQIQRV